MRAGVDPLRAARLRRSPSPAIATWTSQSARQLRQRVDQVLEALSCGPAGRRRRASGVWVAMPSARAAPRAERRSGRKRAVSTPYGTTSTRSGVGAERDRPSREVLAARGDGAGAPEDHPRGAPRRRQRLGDVDVRAVQADDERQRRRGRGGDDAAGTTQWPCMTVARCFARPREPRASRPRAPAAPPCTPRLQPDVGAQRRRVAEDVQRRTSARTCRSESGRRPLLRPRDERMPGRDDVDLVAARGDRRRDRLHERADAVPREPRIRRRHHHDDVAHVTGPRKQRAARA